MTYTNGGRTAINCSEYQLEFRTIYRAVWHLFPKIRVDKIEIASTNAARAAECITLKLLTAMNVVICGAIVFGEKMCVTHE